MKFSERIRRQRKREESLLKKIIIGGAIVVAAMIGVGMYEGDGVLVEDTYVVRQGDCLDEIAEKFLAKNTYGRRYILEFREGIYELNPGLRDRFLQPGEVIKINYWVKAEEGGEDK